MSAKLIEASKEITTESFSHEFIYPSEGRGGYSFPCENGKIVITDANRVNVERCLAGDDGIIDMGIVREVHTYRTPNVWRCDCGETFETHGGHDEQCECGQWYNASGQMLREDCIKF